MAVMWIAWTVVLVLVAAAIFVPNRILAFASGGEWSINFAFTGVKVLMAPLAASLVLYLPPIVATTIWARRRPSN